MRLYKVKDPHGTRRVTIWARDADQEPRYLEIPTGSTVRVEVGKAGPLAAPCEYRRAGVTYRGWVSLEDIPQFGRSKAEAKAAKLAVSGAPGIEVAPLVATPGAGHGKAS